MLRVTIIGLNAISGSLGMKLLQALEEQGQEAEELQIVGYDEDGAKRKEARRLGAVSEDTRSLERAVQDADLVVIATEAGQTYHTLQAIAPHVKEGAIITDTVSTKAPVLQWAREILPPHTSFIGGDPILPPTLEPEMDGSISSARADLLEGAIYCLVPAPDASDEAVNTVQGMAQLVGASPFFLGADEHDGLLAGMHHLPYLLAATLLQTLGESASWRDLKLLADPAFRQQSWLLSLRPDDYHQTCLVNRQPLVSWLDRIINTLTAIRSEMADEQSEGQILRQIVEQAQSSYQDWARRRDEREKEREPQGEIESFGDRLLGLFVPRSFRRPPRQEE